MKVDRIPQVGGLGVLDLLFVGVFRDFAIWERRASIPILTLPQVRILGALRSHSGLRDER